MKAGIFCRQSGAFVLAIIFLSSSALAANDYFVDASNGNDAWSGTLAGPNAARTDGPFASLERARDAIRALKAAGTFPLAGLTVWIRGGTLNRSSIFLLTSQDSGLPGAPVVWRRYRDEQVRLTGARPITGFRPVTSSAVLNRLPAAAHTAVLEADLKAQGVAEYGTLRSRGYLWQKGFNISALELFVNDHPLQLARYPNAGYLRTAGGSSTNVFYYSGTRPSGWANAADRWVRGYWGTDYADSHEKIISLNTSTRSVTTAAVGAYGYKANARYYFYNVLEELDCPGEYYVDRVNGIVYLWPQEPADVSRAVVTMLEQPVIKLQGASNVVIRGLIIEATRGDGVLIEGGADNTIGGCTIRNVGGVGAVIKGGLRNSIVSCDIYDVAENGVLIDRGREHRVHNCEIHHWGRWTASYHPAIQCGMFYTAFVDDYSHQVTHNYIHDAPNMAIQFFGSNHLIEYNLIHNVCGEISDQGAIYSIDRENRYSNNIIRYNHIHHIRTNIATTIQGWTAWTMGIYLDEQSSRDTVYGNIVVDNREYGGNICYLAYSNGGDDLVFENNILINGDPNFAVGYWGTPQRIRFIRNISNGGTFLKLLSVSPTVITFEGNLVDNDPMRVLNGTNVVGKDPLFVDKAGGNYQLQANSPALALGFKQIPQHLIGLIEDEYRVPENAAPNLKPIGAKIANWGQKLAFTISASGGTGSLTYSAQNVPTGASFDPVARQFLWVSAREHVGSHHVLFAVSDGQESAEETVGVTVTDLPLIVPPNYVAYWRFNGDAKDVTGTYDGTLLGGPSYTGGILDECIRLDGVDDRIDFPLSLSQSTDPASDGVTAALWWRPEAIEGTGTLHDEVVIGGYSYHWFVSVPGNEPTAYIYNSTATLYRVRSTMQVQPGTWAHVAAVYGADQTIRIYVDGVLRNQGTWQGAFTPAKIRMCLGNRGNTNVRGLIDEAIIYNRALSGGEVAALRLAQMNRPPVLQPLSDVTIFEGQPLSFTLAVTDPENAPVTYSAYGLPQGATMNASTGAFSWRPTFAQAGRYTITFTASDATATTSITCLITVKNVPPGDLNHDCLVNIVDLILMGDLLRTNPASGNNWLGDLNGDGVIDIMDLIAVRNNMGQRCP